MNLIQAWKAWRLYGRYNVQLITLLKGGQWVNLVVLLAQLLNDMLNVFPQLANNHWFLMVQGILAVVLPSISKTVHELGNGSTAKP